MDDESQTPSDPWFVRLSRSRLDLKISALILLGFFFYKGGVRLVVMLLISFVLLLVVSHFVSRFLRKRRAHHGDSIAIRTIDEVKSKKREDE